jgi:hypothetical protein
MARYLQASPACADDHPQAPRHGSACASSRPIERSELRGAIHAGSARDERIVNSMLRTAGSATDDERAL